MKNTKIVSTIGPATDTKEKIAELVDAGVDVFRQNFSHVDHEQHEEIFRKVRDVSEKTAIMADTKGPEIRLGEIKEGTFLQEGDTLEITAENITGYKDRLPVSYKEFIGHLEKGDEVRIDDGRIELEVVEKNRKNATCRVVYGGEVSTRKAVNVPGKDLGLRTPTEKDREDIEFAAEIGYDFISLSFVKYAEDVAEVREIVEEKDADIDIISKIEHSKAIENFDEILEVSDGVMVARGDLGVELPAARLPALQKKIIRKANKQGKPVITATQMLESMTESPTATRAEISDVANAVLDGTDAVMLSGETAIGEYPIKTVEFMSEIVQEAEAEIEEEIHHTVKEPVKKTDEIISKAVWQAAKDGEADYILAHTTSGGTARKIAKHRPETDIIAFTDSEKVERQLNLIWGVEPYYQESPDTIEEMIEESAQRLQTLGKAGTKDKLILTAGAPISVPGTTNTMQIRTVEQILGS